MITKFNQNNEQELNNLIDEVDKVYIQTCVSEKYLPIRVAKTRAKSLIYEVLKDSKANVKATTIDNSLYIA